MASRLIFVVFLVPSQSVIDVAKVRFYTNLDCLSSLVSLYLSRSLLLLSRAFGIYNVNFRSTYRVMDHYTNKYGNAVIYAVNFTISWTITRANMEVVIMHAEVFVNSPIFIRNFL